MVKSVWLPVIWQVFNFAEFYILCPEKNKSFNLKSIMEKNNGLLTIKNLVKHFDISGGLLDQLSFSKGKISRERTVVKAVNDVSFSIKPGETLSVVGESGCGKSTLARTVLGLYPPNSGEIYYHGDRIDNLSSKEMLPYRTKMQMIFQDPYASLNPRMTVKRTLEEPVLFHNKSISNDKVQKKVADVMEQVGVDPKWADRYPHEFPAVRDRGSALQGH